ncbi:MULTISPECIES: SigE family RNA polymerase sigma factor [Streptomycetaceae]|uniref:SigE family RNA polymerase sigma factor n=1 Tax=Streptomycetaceae TaxID=2062 RepID=UPI00036D45EA|nr:MULTISPECIES: SigE family RNA polymerase sigma factor [Streptomycetaceae]MYX35321.1 SigE family RNA polymerase sigma factor [Streptomyces sp. SID8377]
MNPDDEAEFQGYVRARWAHLVRTAYLLTGDGHHAEDLAQTALAKAYRSWRRVQRSDNPDAYVRRILISCNKDRFRKKRVAERLTDVPPEGAGADPTARVAQREELLAALGELPARQRAVVVLRYWDDLSETEVAHALGCSAGTVKSQAARGLAKLRARLGTAVMAAEPVGAGAGAGAGTRSGPWGTAKHTKVGGGAR